MRVLPVVTRGIRGLGVLFLATFMMTGRAQAQSQDLTFSLGGIPGQTRSFQGSAGTAQISADRGLGVNYGHRFLEAKNAALFGEVEFVALPNRPVTSTTATVPRSYASLYVTPGLRLKPMLSALRAGKSITRAIELAFKYSSIPEFGRAGYVRHCFETWAALGWFSRQTTKKKNLEKE